MTRRDCVNSQLLLGEQCYLGVKIATWNSRFFSSSLSPGIPSSGELKW
jgi:hypothetical protein